MIFSHFYRKVKVVIFVQLGFCIKRKFNAIILLCSITFLIIWDCCLRNIQEKWTNKLNET